MTLKKNTLLLVGLAIASLKSMTALSQINPDANTDEAKVRPYTLPDPLMMADGEKVTSVVQWQKIQRPYLYHLFEENVYGHYPKTPVAIHYKIRETDRNALNGTATRKQVRIFLKRGDNSVFVDVLMYLPNHIKGPAPVFLGYNFSGNATVQPDKAIFLSDRLAFPEFTGPNNDASRGTNSSRWPVKEIIGAGFGVVTAYNGDIELDKPDGWKTGIRTTMKDVLKIQPEEWGAIGAWAWGVSRIMDYLEKDKDVNAKEVAVIGHSRLGKTSLWAGASDPRFSIIIANESGEGGAALSKRWFGETVKIINTSFPYWFVDAYKKYNDNTDALPLDQHELLALIAPRPLYVSSASEDLWADPKGQFLSALHAGPVYELFGKKGIGTGEEPPLFHPVGSTIQYHIREGKHDINLYDWQQFIRFAKEKWK
ncbi:MAG: hypothetical protein ABIO82_06675 [Ginsengibacter sp.]